MPTLSNEPPKIKDDLMYQIQNLITDYVVLSGDELHSLAKAILSKLETIEQEARGCVDCKTLRCENCERLRQT